MQGLKNTGKGLEVEIEKMLQRNQKRFLKQILSVFQKAEQWSTLQSKLIKIQKRPYRSQQSLSRSVIPVILCNNYFQICKTWFVFHTL